MAVTKTGFVKGNAKNLKGNAHEGFTEGQKEHVEKMGKVVGKESAGKIGHYAESTGGGTPIPAGEKLADHPEAKRVQQPRDEEGKFTYNSVNLKTLKYGPSRGKTVPPFMKGVTMTYVVKKDGNSTVSDGKLYKTHINMSAEEFVNSMQEYKSNEGGFLGIVNARVESKRGRRSQAEKDMLGSGKEGFVDNIGNGSTTSLSKYKTIADFEGDCATYNSRWEKEKEKFGERKFTRKKKTKKENPQPENNEQPKPGDNNDQPKLENNEQPNQTSINDEDVEMAKNNPEQFLDKYDKEIDEIVELANSKKAGIIDVDALIGLVGQGKKDVFEKIKAKLNSM